jgi:hypothetical protein
MSEAHPFAVADIYQRRLSQAYSDGVPIIATVASDGDEAIETAKAVFLHELWQDPVRPFEVFERRRATYRGQPVYVIHRDSEENSLAHGETVMMLSIEPFRARPSTDSY